MKYFIDTADVAEIREAASWGLIDGVTTNPIAHRQDRAPLSRRAEGDLRNRRRPDQRRSRRHRSVGDDRGGREARQAPQEHRRQVPDDRRRLEGDARAGQTRHPRQRHSDLHSAAGAGGGKSRRVVPVAVHRPPRRHRPGRLPNRRADGANPRRTTITPPKCWWHPCARRRTCSARPKSAPT